MPEKDISVHERLATLEEQGRWLAPRVEKMDAKLDKLLEDRWKRFGAATVISGIWLFVVTIATAFIARGKS